MGIKNTVLLVEDDPIALKVHQGYLEQMGFMMDVAADGNQAIELYKKNNSIYKAVILDAGLPDISGYTVARFIRQYELKKQLKHTPVLILSAYPHDQVKQACIAVEVDNFAIKPVRYEDLKKLLLANC